MTAQFVFSTLLFGLMLSIGLRLTWQDFAVVLKSPRAVLVGTAGQIVLLPIMSICIVRILAIEPGTAVGAVLLAASPAGSLSNVLAALARANVPLSLTLTAFGSVLSAVTMPIVLSLGTAALLGEGTETQVPFAAVASHLAVLCLVPVSLGIFLGARQSRHAERFADILQRAVFTTGTAILVAAFLFTPGMRDFGEELGPLVIAAGTWAGLAMALGWVVGGAFGLDDSKRFTFGLEFATRNIPIATLVAVSTLDANSLALFPAAYAAVGYPITFAAVLWRRLQTQGA